MSHQSSVILSPFDLYSSKDMYRNKREIPIRLFVWCRKNRTKRFAEKLKELGQEEVEIFAYWLTFLPLLALLYILHLQELSEL